MSSISHIVSPDNDTVSSTSVGAVVSDLSNNQKESSIAPDSRPDQEQINKIPYSEPSAIRSEVEDESQRKRSKVSRACDECRRKKIKCDAMLNGNNHSLEKACTSCIKNGDQCLFERVPLKRGPTKGFASSNRSRSNSRSSRHDSISSIHSVQSNSGQIILPPLTSLTVPIDNQIQPPHSASGPSSPRRLSINSQQSLQAHQQQQQQPPHSSIDYSSVNNLQQQQSGLFWKVPSSFNRRGSNVSVDSDMSNDRFSISSSSSNFKPQFRTKSYESSVISDSEDDNRMLMSASPNLNSLRVSINSNNGNLPVDARGQAVLLENYYKLIHPINPILIERDQLNELISSLETTDINQVLVNFLYHALDLFLNNNGDRSNMIITLNQLYLKIFQLYQTYHNFLRKNLNSLYFYLSTLLILNVKLFNLGDFDTINLNFTNIIFKKFKVFSNFWTCSIVGPNSLSKKAGNHLKSSYFNLCYLNALTSLAINSERDGLNIVRFDFKHDNKEESIMPSFPKFLLNFTCFKQSIFKDFNYSKDSIYNNYVGLVKGFLNDDVYSQIFEGPNQSGMVSASLETNFFRLIKLNYELLYKIDVILKTQKSTEIQPNSKNDLIMIIDQTQFQLYDTLNQQLAVLKLIVPMIISEDGSTKSKDQESTLLTYSSLSILLLNKAISLIKLQQIFLNVFKINYQLSFKISMNFNDVINLIQMIPNFNSPSSKFDSNSLQFFVNLNLPNTLGNLDLSLVQLIYQNYMDLLKGLYVYLLERDLKYGWVSN